jgi:hypothetical protein
MARDFYTYHISPCHASQGLVPSARTHKVSAYWYCLHAHAHSHRLKVMKRDPTVRTRLKCLSRPAKNASLLNLPIPTVSLSKTSQLASQKIALIAKIEGVDESESFIPPSFAISPFRRIACVQTTSACRLQSMRYCIAHCHRLEEILDTISTVVV